MIVWEKTSENGGEAYQPAVFLHLPVTLKKPGKAKYRFYDISEVAPNKYLIVTLVEVEE